MAHLPDHGAISSNFMLDLIAPAVRGRALLDLLRNGNEVTIWNQLGSDDLEHITT